jgi:septum formation protein
LLCFVVELTQLNKQLNKHTFMNPFHFSPIYLASQSPRRAQLLDLIGVAHEVYRPDDAAYAETLEAEIAGESPHNYVQRVARLKATYAAQSLAKLPLVGRPILCADTTVALDDLILAKPVDATDAARMLRLLSGRTHQVHTAVAIAHAGGMLETCVTSEVTFKELSQADINAYIQSGEPFGKAGAYAIQGIGAMFISHLSGSYSAVMGLPIFEVSQMLKNVQLDDHGKAL